MCVCVFLSMFTKTFHHKHIMILLLKKKKKCILQKLIEHTVCAKHYGEKLPTRHVGSQEVLMGRKNLYNPATALGALSECVG